MRGPFLEYHGRVLASSVKESGLLQQFAFAQLSLPNKLAQSQALLERLGIFFAIHAVELFGSETLCSRVEDGE